MVSKESTLSRPAHRFRPAPACKSHYNPELRLLSSEPMLELSSTTVSRPPRSRSRWARGPLRAEAAPRTSARRARPRVFTHPSNGPRAEGCSMLSTLSRGGESMPDSPRRAVRREWAAHGVDPRDSAGTPEPERSNLTRRARPARGSFTRPSAAFRAEVSRNGRALPRPRPPPRLRPDRARRLAPRPRSSPGWPPGAIAGPVRSGRQGSRARSGRVA